uniref:Recep_L_domain domain-containing protein n=1 Tax=Caenorhabditis tropicalis TaxID=1561998 RepID=A0A1I7U2P2_9PELO
MTEIGMKFYTLDPDQPRLSVRISGVLGFCIHIGEITNFIIRNPVDTSLLTNFCNVTPTDTSNFDEKICEIGNFSLPEFDESCRIIVGNVVVKGGDEAYVDKLKSLKLVFGAVIIKGTSLSVIDFFDDLEYVLIFDIYQYAIQILRNPNLIDISFPSLKVPGYKNIKLFSIQENNEKLKSDPEVCYRLMNSTNAHIPLIDNKTCESALPTQS